MADERERQIQAATVAYNKRARQARHPRLKGSHFITICEIKCSVPENSANNSCSAFFVFFLAVKNPLVSIFVFAYCRFGRWRGRYVTTEKTTCHKQVIIPGDIIQ